MSGIISEGDDPIRRYHQRFNELIQRNPNRSIAASTTGTSSELAVNNTQPANKTLATHQFYMKNLNQNQFQHENILSNHLVESSSTCTGVSDSSVFKKPLPVKKFNCRPHVQRRIDFVVKRLRSVEDWPTLKYLITSIETLLHTVENPPCPVPVDPLLLTDVVSSLIKEEYMSMHVPKSICGSSIMSDQASNIDHCAGNSERSIRLAKPSVSSTISDSRVLQDITQSSVYRAQSNKPPQDFTGSSYYRSGELASYYQQEASRVNEGERPRVTHETTHPNMTHVGNVGRQPMERLIETGSSFNVLDDSEIARRRDAAAANQEDSVGFGVEIPKTRGRTKPLPKSTPKPRTVNCNRINKSSKVSATANKKPSNRQSKGPSPSPVNCTLDKAQKNISLLNGTGNGVSRCGRPLKAPVQYWNSKGEELSYLDESVFNESMTLRNKKVVEKKKTPPVGNKNNTQTIPKNNSAATRSRGKPALSEKENISVNKKKPVKKRSGTPAVKNTSTELKKKNNKGENTDLNPEKPMKKPAPKRKLKEPNHSMSKKKKTEDSMASDIDEDIFGAASYKKTTYQYNKVALSPSAALSSAKKAAGEAQGKATPPCKAIGDMMANESTHSIMSAAKEAPKQNEAIKRIIKKMEKDQIKQTTQLTKNVKAKSEVQKTRKKEDFQLNEMMEELKSSYSVKNPMCSAILTVSRKDWESDSSDMEEEDDDDVM